MVLENKFFLTNSAELAKVEERITKLKAKKLYDNGLIDKIEVGTFQGLAEIHQFLFEDSYDFAGKVRDVNLVKGNFRFASVMYLSIVLDTIDQMPQSSFEKIVKKYVEMNVAHPFREGNGRAMRIWLDLIFKKEQKQVVDWSTIDKDDYLLAMERSPIKEVELQFLLKNALTSEVNNREIYMKGIDQSYSYEGYTIYKTDDLGGGKESS